MKNAHGWSVGIDPEAIDEAFEEILEKYPDHPAQDDMLGWMQRFLEDVTSRPFDVLGFPPRQVVFDPDMMYFPGDAGVKISGIGHVSKKQKIVRVFKILVQEPRRGRL